MKFDFFKKKWGKNDKNRKENLQEKESFNLDKKEEGIDFSIKYSSEYRIFPVLTDKSLKLAQQGKYTFAVYDDLNKYQIKKIIEKLFNVEVTKVNTINYPKRIKGRTRIKSIRKKFKKALVFLKKGQKIPIFE